MNKLITFLATGFFVGKAPYMPGTIGTLIGVLLYLVLRYLPTHLYLVTVITFIFLSIWLATKAENILDKKDPSEVVIDEIVGFLVTMTFHPFKPIFIFIGFVLFRFFDILKPFPIGYIDKRLAKGWGIVGDDVMAGIYANITLWVVRIVLQM